MGIAATGRRVHLQGMVFSRIVDGRIAEEWRIIDSAGLLAQLTAPSAHAEDDGP
jgi:predicted ester cyclase